MSRGFRIRIEVALAGAAAALGLATIAVPTWIEVVLRVDPDRGTGSTEWLFVSGLFVLSAGLALITRAERRSPAGERP